MASEAAIAETALTRPLASAATPRRSGLGEVILGGLLLAAIALACLIVPAVSPYGTSDFVADPLQAPSWSHPFGTDTFGRDVFVRVFAGGRLDLLIVVGAVSVPFILGTVLGTTVATLGYRWIDVVLTRTIDAIVAFPFVIFILVLVVLFGADRSYGGLPPGVPAFFAAVWLVGWAVYARLARAEAMTLRERDYVVAARLLGYTNARIVRRHVIPFVFGTTLTYAVGDAVGIVAVAAALPFLGAGVQPPIPEWGSIMFEGRGVLETAWWVAVTPGAMAALTGIGFSLVADGLLVWRGRES
jgi:peptide/nickel transport system permease protein